MNQVGDVIERALAGVSAQSLMQGSGSPKNFLLHRLLSKQNDTMLLLDNAWQSTAGMLRIIRHVTHKRLSGMDHVCLRRLFPERLNDRAEDILAEI